MRLPPFELHRPRTVAEASRLLRELAEDAAAYHGGTELLLAMKLGLAGYPHLVDLKRVAQLSGIRRDGDVLVIGAGATHRAIESSPDVRAAIPAMSQMAAAVANVRVRSVGTIGGNLCFADPHSDPATFLLAAGATLVCGDGGGTSRRLGVGEFVLGAYETALSRGELLLGVEVPVPPPGAALSHLRIRMHERPAVTTTCYVELSGHSVTTARVAVGSVSGSPLLVSGLESRLAAGGPGAPSQRALAECAEAVAGAVSPVEDGEGSVEYKTALVGVLVRRGLEAALAAAGAGAP